MYFTKISNVFGLIKASEYHDFLSKFHVALFHEVYSSKHMLALKITCNERADNYCKGIII